MKWGNLSETMESIDIYFACHFFTSIVDYIESTKSIRRKTQEKQANTFFFCIPSFHLSKCLFRLHAYTIIIIRFILCILLTFQAFTYIFHDTWIMLDRDTELSGSLAFWFIHHRLFFFCVQRMCCMRTRLYPTNNFIFLLRKCHRNIR